jgi:hypothetical protein
MPAVRPVAALRFVADDLAIATAQAAPVAGVRRPATAREIAAAAVVPVAALTRFAVAVAVAAPQQRAVAGRVDPDAIAIAMPAVTPVAGTFLTVLDVATATATDRPVDVLT